MKNKEFSKNNLPKLYKSSPLFKKYYDYSLWFGSPEEFYNIKYCEKYLYEHNKVWIKKKLLVDIDLSSYSSLIGNPRFIKFTKSGFLRYINYDFLVSFYNNSFLLPFEESKKSIEIFVDEYFQTYLKDKLEKDLLYYLLKSIKDSIFCFSKVGTTNSYPYVILKIFKPYKKVYTILFDYCIEKTKIKYSNNLKTTEWNKLNSKKNIQVLFESINLFSNLEEKKESIGLHNTINIVFKIDLKSVHK